MAAMYFNPDKTATREEAFEGLFATSQQIDHQVELSEQEENYPGEGAIGAQGSPVALDQLKTLAEGVGVPVKAERVEYAPDEAREVDEIFVEGYFDSEDE